ncbi:MAG TPA: DegT/DnrJ/EryC1/StrS family aminotransferase [Pyrinomonadaceae bacterium]|nr:DegT/DnrJ/EryC1/StrS family aminotransferase [Pyrinomonadaceae bacterium]
MTKLQVPFFRPALHEEEVSEVVATLRSGWLTSGPKVKRFEEEFAAAVSAENKEQKEKSKGPSAKSTAHSVHAVAVNSGTAALHLAVEALGLKPGQGVLVPTMTFAATAEVVRYQGAIPILVDCDPLTLNMNLADADSKAQGARKRGQSAKGKGQRSGANEIVGIMPVHVGGVLMDLGQLEQFAQERKLWVVEDAAHAFPAGWRRAADEPWKQRSNGSKAVTCYSFYANKTITTGEGGMAVTSNSKLAQRMRLMSLHGLSADAWGRYSTNGNWDYKIVAPGYKYNLTDIAAAIGIHQLGRAEAMRREREQIARHYSAALAVVEQIELPPYNDDRIDSWHLFAIKLRLKRLTIDRDGFMNELKQAGVGCSVHWRPLHLHPYYQQTFGWRAKDFPVATAQWKRLISLPIFPGMREDEIEHVIRTVKRICRRYCR